MQHDVDLTFVIGFGNSCPAQTKGAVDVILRF